MTERPPALPRNRRTDAFERSVATALEGLITPGEPLVVACSGGPDSVAVLVATHRATPSSALVAAYFDHGLRPPAETEADATFVHAVAELVGGCAVAGRPELPLAGDEATARGARYGWLATVLAEAACRTVLTGHTQDDQAETVLLNLARGTGLRGARGMRAESAWPAPSARTAGLCVLRPLLERTRAEVEDYLDALGLEPRLDPTNERPTYARNRVRNDVLPALESVNQRVRDHLAAFAGRAAEADAALDEWAAAEFEAHGAAILDRVRLERRRLGELPPAVAKRVLSLGARRVGLELEAAQQEQLLRIASRRGAQANLAGGQAWTDERWLVLRARGGLDTGPETA